MSTTPQLCASSLASSVLGKIRGVSSPSWLIAGCTEQLMG
jgi:hypothetical protein